MKQILKVSSGLPRAFLLAVLALSSASALAPGTAAADPVVETASGSPSPAPETGFAADHKCALWAP